MRLSRRITGLSGSGTDGWDLFLRARRIIAEGIAVTELTIGGHDTRTHSSILDAMDRSARSGHTGYAMVPGTALLRDTVAARVQERTGQRITRDNVGGQAALFAAHSAACDPGESLGKAATGHVRVAMTVADDAFAKALKTLCHFAAQQASRLSEG